MDADLPVDRGLVDVGSTPGYVFFADRGDQLCFVPAVLVAFDTSGNAVIDYIRYVASGWSQRNARWSMYSDGCAHAFPDDRRLVAEGGVPSLRQQLDRWRELAR